MIWIPRWPKQDKTDCTFCLVTKFHQMPICIWGASTAGSEHRLLQVARIQGTDSVSFETGWDVGRFAAELQCLHLDTPLLPQQNTKKPYGTKNSCVLGQSSTNSGQKIQRDQENQLPLLRNLERKQGSQEQKQFTLHICMPLHTIPPKRWANNLSHPSGLTPGHIPTLTP